MTTNNMTLKDVEASNTSKTLFKSTQELTIGDITAHESVKAFIQKVLDQVYTEDEGRVIRDELTDHIFSLAEDYVYAGHNKDTSIRKALLQMGDPAEIGYSFTDYEGMRRRKFLRIGLKILSVFILLLTFGIMIYFAEPSANTSQAEERSIGDMLLNLYYVVYFPVMIMTSLKAQGQYGINGIPLNKIKISNEPLLVLWASKKRFPWEYIAFSLFFLPIIIVFMIMFAYEGNNPLLMGGVLGTVCFSIWLFYHSEKYRIPKYLIFEEGIVIKNKFISWASIDRISWTKDYMSQKKEHYRLTLEHVIRTSNNGYKSNYLTIKKIIDVNSNQYHQVITLLKERV